MPKVKWGGDLSQSDIDNAEVREGFTPYSGPVPPAGVYRFRVSSMKVGESGTGNPKLVSIWHLDGSWRKEHKRFDGAPLFDHMPVMKSTGWRVKALCAALGISSADFMNKMVTDPETERVTKIGRLTIDEDTVVYASVKQEKGTEYGDRITLQSYIAPPEADDDDDTDAGGDDDDDSDGTPF